MQSRLVWLKMAQSEAHTCATADVLAAPPTPLRPPAGAAPPVDTRPPTLALPPNATAPPVPVSGVASSVPEHPATLPVDTKPRTIVAVMVRMGHIYSTRVGAGEERRPRQGSLAFPPLPCSVVSVWFNGSVNHFRALRDWTSCVKRAISRASRPLRRLPQCQRLRWDSRC